MALRFGALVLCAVAAGCAEAVADRPVVERTDSAGVEIVITKGTDRPLAWSFDPELSLGGADDGPESFFDINDGFVSTDAAGNIYILDYGNRRVLVFDSVGQHLRGMGRKGGGPGEFEWVGGFSVAPDGAVSLYDWGKRGFVSWDRAGELMPSEPVRAGYGGGRVVRTATGRVVIPIDSIEGDRARRGTTLYAIRGGDTTAVLSHFTEHMEHRDFGCVSIGAMPRLLEPALVWEAVGDTVLATGGAEYTIDVYHAGRLRSSLRRDVPPRAVTEEMAKREVGESMKITFGRGGGCEVPPDKVVEVRGHAPFLQPVRRIAVAPDGRIWVRRGVLRDEEMVIEIFDADGSYAGTLPVGSPWPAAFMPDGRVVAIEKDELDIQRVTVYRVNRGV